MNMHAFIQVKLLFIFYFYILGSISTTDLKFKETTPPDFSVSNDLVSIDYKDQLQNLKYHDIKCDSGYGLQKFSFIQTVDNKFKFIYSCAKMLLNNCVINNYNLESDCGFYTEPQTILYLNSQKVFAGTNKIITRFILIPTPTDDTKQTNICKIKYEYDICDLQQCDSSCL